MLKPYAELRKVDVLPFCEMREAKDDKGKTIKVPYLNWAKCVDLLYQNGAEKVFFEPCTLPNGSSLIMSDEKFALSVDLVKDSLDAVLATAAAATRLREVCDLLNRGQTVLRYDAANLVLADIKAHAELLVLEIAICVRTGLVVLDRGLKRLAPHDAAMHLLRRKSTEIVRDLLVCDLLGLFERLADHHLRESGAGGDGGGTSERTEFRIDDLAVLAKLELERKRVAACERTDCRRSVRVFDLSNVPRIAEMVQCFLCIIPHKLPTFK